MFLADENQTKNTIFFADENLQPSVFDVWSVEFYMVKGFLPGGGKSGWFCKVRPVVSGVLSQYIQIFFWLSICAGKALCFRAERNPKIDTS